MLELQRRNLVAKEKIFGWFAFPAGVIVVGALLVGERIFFGQTPSTAKVLIGTLLLVIGVSYFFYVLYLKKSRGGDA